MPSEYALAAAKHFVSTEFNGWFGTSPIEYTDFAPDGEDTQIANELAEIIDNEFRPLFAVTLRALSYMETPGDLGPDEVDHLMEDLASELRGVGVV